MSRFRKYFGNKEFYIGVFSLIIPIMVQQLFVSVAGYVDSIMINSFGGTADAYNGVSAANRLIFVLNFVWMGLASSASIFIAQYFGAKKSENVKESIRLSMYVAFVFGIIGFFVMHLFGNMIVNSFVQGEMARQYGYQYIEVIKYGAVILSLNIAFASAFRSVKLPKVALFASSIGIVVNVILNYLLIFGHFGFPEMGASGAALATILSKCVEFIVYIFIFIFSKNEYFYGLFKKLKITKQALTNYTYKALPLVTNELLWSLGMIIFAKYYTYNNDLWYSAYSYSQNISDLFFIVFSGLGTGTAVVIGSRLGQGDYENALKEFYHFRGLAIIMGGFVGILMIITTPLVTKMFTSDPDTSRLTIYLLCITGIFTAIYCYNSVSFFTLRSGGDSIKAFILDQGPSYLIGLPLCIILGVNAKTLGLQIYHVYLITHTLDIAKIFLGNHFIKKKTWLKNLAV